jgi:hypothetical protein
MKALHLWACVLVLGCGATRDPSAGAVPNGGAGGTGDSQSLGGNTGTGGDTTGTGGSAAGTGSSAAGTGGSVPGLAGAGAVNSGPPVSFWRFGTAANEASALVAVDQAENIYIGGTTNGELVAGQQSSLFDVFIRKYDATQNVLWTMQLPMLAGTVQILQAAVDSAGNFLIAAMNSQGFVNKYDPSGTLLWSTQGAWQIQSFVVGPQDDVYAVGSLVSSTNANLTDTYIARYDASGASQWFREYPTADGESAKHITLDGAGNIYIAGTKELPGDPTSVVTVGFLRKHDPSGTPQWTQQLGTPDENEIFDLAADPSGDIYVVGYTAGALGGPNLGEKDAVLRKYDPAGNVLWTQQFGTSKDDIAVGVRTDRAGNLYVSGITEGNLDALNAGIYDPFFRKYDPDGNLLWATQAGTAGADGIYSFALAASGNLYAAGLSSGYIGSDALGGTDDAVVFKVAASGWTAP